MKVVIAMMQHETNTFSLLPTNLDAFSRVVGLQKPPSDKQAIDLYGDADMAFAGLLDIARSYGVECIVPIAAYAEPSGIVDDDAFNFICKKICAAVKKGCDAILLDLHGESDPLSAIAEYEWEWEYGRDNWQTKTHTYTRITSDLNHFYLYAVLIAWENNKQVFKKVWDEQFKRDHF